MSEFNKIENDRFYLGLCKLNGPQLKLAYKNPHCSEYFCTMKNIIDCTSCYNEFVQKNIYKMPKVMSKLEQERNVFEAYERYKDKLKNMNCDKRCHVNGLIYGTAKSTYETIDKYEIDKFKVMDKFNQKNLIEKYNDIPYLLKYEGTVPKPRTVVHFGQLKMFLVTLIFLLEKVNPNDKIVNIIYPGSARGDNILLLCDMFPNTRWHLIDPHPFHPRLYNHPQVIDCLNEFFTDELATKYSEKFKNRKESLLFISDIRLETTDESVIRDQRNNANWHKIIKPDYSYLKFRCPYENPEKYNYYDGDIYIQPFAPIASTESRILLETELKEKVYDKFEYEGKILYFNRVLRPSHYESLIGNHEYLDGCWDCVYFGYLIEKYIEQYPNNTFKTKDIKQIMNNILNFITKKVSNKIKETSINIRQNLMNKFNSNNTTESKVIKGKRIIK
jgi:hypothetical protein